MRLFFLLFGLSLLTVTSSGCQAQETSSTTTERESGSTSPTSESTDGQVAVPVPGWSGINNLFREGNTYFSGQLDEASWRSFVTEAGIETVVVLRADQELAGLPFDQPALLKDLGVTVVSVPVSPDTFSRSDTQALAHALDASTGPVLVQCGSSNRSGGLWAAYLALEQGLPLEEALQRGRAAGLRSDAMVDAVRRVVEEQ